MKRRIISIAMFVLFVLAVITVCYIHQQALKDTVAYTIERVDKSVVNDSGDIIATIYYDKVKINDNTAQASKINEEINSVFKYWSDSDPDAIINENGTLESILNQTAEFRKIFGDSVLVKQPLEFSVHTNVLYAENSIVSFMMTITWSAGGPKSVEYQGYTYSLLSGELITFDQLIDVDGAAFRDNLCYYLILENNYHHWMSNDELKSIFTSSTLSDFDIEQNGKVYSINENYAYNGKDFYIILNMLGNSCEIVKWNGKTGNDFEASWL